MKKSLLLSLSLFFYTQIFSANSLLNGDYSFLQEITFELYNDNIPPYKIPVHVKSIEETLMFEVLHATWLNKKWVAYTMNKSLLGTYKVGQPALLDKGSEKRMYFVAALPGSTGGLDLYFSDYKNGKWNKPTNLGKSVNTVNNESNPGLLNDNTLTYSSNGIIKKLDLTTLQVTNHEVTVEEKKNEIVKNLENLGVKVEEVKTVKPKEATFAIDDNTSNPKNTTLNTTTISSTTTSVNNNVENKTDNVNSITKENIPIVQPVAANPIANNKDEEISKAKLETQKILDQLEQDRAALALEKAKLAAEKEKFLQEKALSQNNHVAETPKVVVTETPKVVINSTPIQKPIVSTVSSQESIGFKTQSEMLATHGSAIQLGAYLNPNWNLINQFTEFGKIVSFKNDKGLNVVWITGFNSRSEADLTLQKVRSKAGFQNAIALGK